MATVSGAGLYRSALVVETMANLLSLPAIFLYPDAALSYLVTGPAQITPATRSLLQWFGCVVIGVTVPLTMCYSKPDPGHAGDRQVSMRRATYLLMGTIEVAFVGFWALQYALGYDSGMSNGGLIGGIVSLSSLIAMRAFFLYVKPEWMESEEKEEWARQ